MKYTVEGTNLDLPDTPENERCFGRPGAGRGKAAWPVAAVITLIEVGTRLTVDAFVGRYKTSEQSAARRPFSNPVPRGNLHP